MWIPWVFVFIVLIRSQGLYVNIPGEHEINPETGAAERTSRRRHLLHEPGGVHQEVAGAHRRRGERLRRRLGASRSTRAALDVPHPAAAVRARDARRGGGARRRARVGVRVGEPPVGRAPRRARRVELARRDRLPSSSSPPRPRPGEEACRLVRAPLRETRSLRRRPRTLRARRPSRLGLRGEMVDVDAAFDGGPAMTAAAAAADRRPRRARGGGRGGRRVHAPGGQVHSFYYGDPLFEALDNDDVEGLHHLVHGPLPPGGDFQRASGTTSSARCCRWRSSSSSSAVIGKFKAGPLPRTFAAREWELTRRWIMNKLLPNGTFRGAVGRPREALRLHLLLYRALGAKIGRRVFWPGSGPRGRRDVRPARSWRRRGVGKRGPWCSPRTARARTRCDRSRRQRQRPVRLYAGATLCEDACLGLGRVAGRKSRVRRREEHLGRESERRRRAARPGVTRMRAPKGKDGEERGPRRCRAARRCTSRRSRSGARCTRGRRNYFCRRGS